LKRHEQAVSRPRAPRPKILACAFAKNGKSRL
jgi:hypothetical protein